MTPSIRGLGNPPQAASRNTKERIAAEGFEIGATSAARLQEVMKRDIAKWTKVVKTANIRVAQ